MLIRTTACAVLVFASGAWAETFTIPIDNSQSSMTATLTLIGQSAVDTSPVSGFVVLKLDTVRDPLQVSGLDFFLEADETLTLNLSFGILGAFNSTLTDLAVLYATPGTPTVPALLNMQQFEFVDVPTNTAGILNYTATGFVCTTLMQEGLPCIDTDDLSTEPTQLITFGGTIMSGPGRVVEVEASIDRTAPVDPANPDLGTIRVQAVLRGSVFVPVIPGDANGDCDVSFADITAILANFGSDTINGDSDNSGSVDFADITVTLANWGASCN